MNKKFAVLGSNSFAGATFIARALFDGAEVIGFNRSTEASNIFLPYKNEINRDKFTFIQADINHDLKKIIYHMDSFQPEVIVDFSGQGMVAESWNNPEQWYATNFVSKVKLHDQLRTKKWMKKFIRISTPEVYGSNEIITKENWQFNPSTPYAVSHAAIDLSLRAFHKQYNFPVIFTRFANFYGPGQQLYRIIPKTIIHSFMGRKLKLQGGGSPIRAFIYGDDVADGIMRAADNGLPGNIYHFSTDRFLSIKELVGIICDHLKVPFSSLAEIAPERKGNDQAYLMDSSRAQIELGWNSRVGLEKGIEITTDWIKGAIDEINKLPLEYIHKI